MDYVVPAYTQEEVIAAGKILAEVDPSAADLRQAIAVFSNWRAAHNYPLNSVTVVLKRRATKVAGRQVLPVQRLKRIESVERKLKKDRARLEREHLEGKVSKREVITLASMQDMGGCRAIMASVDEVFKLRDLYMRANLTHQLKQQNDYIAGPKKDGYRGIHLVYFFRGKKGNERAKVYANREMQVEIQLRTSLQHYWATAVETAETFTRTPMKSQGDENTTPWRRFFALVSSCFAHEEGCPLVPKMTKDMTEVIGLMRELEKQHRFCDSLTAFTATVEYIDRDKAKYFLVELDLDTRAVTVRGFRPSESAKATEQYTAMEQGSLIARNTNAVLVSAKDIAQLKRAYPNYFADTKEFVTRVRALMA